MAARLLIDTVLAAHQRILWTWERVFCRGLHCEKVTAFPTSLDQSLAEMTPPFGCHRSGRWLNWILHHSLIEDPLVGKDLYLVRDRNNNTVAHFITRKKLRRQDANPGCFELLIGSVLDWGVFDVNSVGQKQVFLLSTTQVATQGVDVVEICGPPTQSPLPPGFSKRGHHRFVLRTVPSDARHTNFLADLLMPRQIDGDSGLS